VRPERAENDVSEVEWMPGTLIEEPSVVRAWASAAMRICAVGEPPTFMAVSAGAEFVGLPNQLRELDDCADALNAERPSTVAEVLVPSRVLATPGNTAARFMAGWCLLGRARRRGLKFSGWSDTYFERLTGNRMGPDLVLRKIKENRLRSVIEKINLWGRDIEAALYAHTDLPTDTPRTRGGPCLQYVQFRPFNGSRLELFALYRAHDYFNKALGNMIGLQRLGAFVAGETGRVFVGQTVFSLHPIVGSSKQHLRGLVESVRAIPGI
jgi:hypothetical protein